MDCSLQNLPKELLLFISQFLGVLEFFSLSRTSNVLRQIYHPLLFTKCRLYYTKKPRFETSRIVNDGTFFSKLNSLDQEKLTLSVCEWAIPSDAFYNPHKYSWFCNEAVKIIVTSDYQYLMELANNVSLSDYPKIQSILFLRRLFPGVALIDYDWKKISEGESFRYDYNKNISFNMIDFLPVVKHCSNLLNYEPQVESIGRAIQSSKYLFNCCSGDVRSSITSLNIKMIHFLSEHSSQSRLLNLDNIPNLKCIYISTDSKTSFDVFKKVVESLPKCLKLEKLSIDFISFNNVSSPSIQLLDNLKGGWRYFRLKFFNPTQLTPSFRLPTVTHLELNGISSSYANIDFGPNIEILSIFSQEKSAPFKMNYFDKALENLRILSINLSIKYDMISQSKCIFKKILPNLKLLNVSTNGMETRDIPESFGNIDPIIFNDFKTMMKIALFGDFDMLNLQHMEPLIKSINKRFDNLDESDDGLFLQRQPLNKSLLQSVRSNDIFDTCKYYFQLQYTSTNNEFSDLESCIVDRIYLSIIFNDILHCLPNLQTLNLQGLSSIEEFPTFHKLIKHHSSLKKIHLKLLHHPVINFQTSNDHFYNRIRKFTTPFSSNDGTDRLSVTVDGMYSNFMIDVEAARNRFHKYKDYLRILNSEKGEISPVLFKLGCTLGQFQTGPGTICPESVGNFHGFFV